MKPEAGVAWRTVAAAANWHLAWFLALAFCALVWAATPAPRADALALAAAAAPGALGLLLRWRQSAHIKILLALAWPLGVGCALYLTGGISGPMAALVLAPPAAMAMLDNRRLIAVDAALTAAVVAALALASGAGLVAAPFGDNAWLALISLTAAGLGLAAALLLVRARSGEREAMQAAEVARLKSLLEGAPIRLLRLDAQGVVREAFGGPPGETAQRMIGRPFETLACDADRDAAREALAQAAQTGAAKIGFAPPLAPDRWLAADLRALADGGALAHVRDASQERAREAFLEQARQEAEALTQAKSRFLANMSHELRTPLNAVIGFSDIMRSALFGPLSSRYAEYAGLIHESGGHLLDLINDVLDMSKIEAERFTLSREVFDAREAVAAALRLTRVQADTARIGLRGVLPPAAIEVDADRRALKQIVLNLVSNALKFTPAGGQVTVIARAQGEDLELIVADTGTGIARADLERLGRPYEQAGGADQRALGTGLGLSLVRAFAELHGGRMTIRSLLGEGTVVSVRMPVIAAPADIPQAPPEPPPAPAPAPARRAAALGDNVIAFNPR